MEICIVRHGQTDWNLLGKLQGQTDIPLNEKGLEQAKKCAATLANQGYELIVSSPLQRAYQTAQCIGNQVNLSVQIMDEWTERSFGVVEGMTMEERNAKYPSFDYPDAELFTTLQARIRRALAKMSILPHQKVIVVSHGAIINALIALLTNGEAGTGKTGIENGSFTYIQLENEQWHIVSFNEIEHMKK